MSNREFIWLRYIDKSNSHFIGNECTTEILKTCKDYNSSEGLYDCSYCNMNGLKLLDYGTDKSFEYLSLKTFNLNSKKKKMSDKYIIT